MAIITYARSLVAVGVVFFLSFADFGNGPQLFNNADKVVHFVMFVFLAFFFCIDSRKLIEKYRIKTIAICLIVALLFGGISELGQTLFTDYRNCDIIDFIADAIGAAVGCLLANVFLIFKN